MKGDGPAGYEWAVREITAGEKADLAVLRKDSLSMDSKEIMKW
jgi:predicted amidohydrolase YtcJ